jgi:dCTP deaminase
MTIKSDKWIKRQCTPPSFIVTELVPQVVPEEDLSYLVHRPPRPVERAFYGSEEQIIQAIRDRQARGGSLASATGIIDYRKLTEEELAKFVPMIAPFEPGNIRTIKRPMTDAELAKARQDAIDMDANTMPSGFVDQKILSYGTSSFGYDVTLGNDFRIFTNLNTTVIDPLAFDESCLHEHKGDFCIIPPNSYILGVTREYFKIPRDVMVICVGKSTYARCGAIVNVTPIEPGFEGHVVIEISNATSLPLKIYANQGIAQFMFFQSDEECETSYADKGGKYQGQTGVTLAKG